MTLEQQTKTSQLKQKFQLKNAELQYVEAETEALEAKKNVLTIELEEIKTELIFIKDEQQAEPAKPAETVDNFETPHLDLNLNLENKLTGEVTLDFTQPTQTITEAKKEPTDQIVENIENYLSQLNE